MAKPRGFNRRSAAGPASADYSYFFGCYVFHCGCQTTLPKAWVFHASQNLRSGVRLTRWCSTW